MFELTYRPAAEGGWLVIVADSAFVVLEPAALALIEPLRMALGEPAAFEAVVGVVTSDGFARTPSFALVEWTGADVRTIVRGGLDLEIVDGNGSNSVSGSGVSTWTERGFTAVSTVELTVAGAQAVNGVPLLGLRSGDALVAEVRLSASASGGAGAARGAGAASASSSAGAASSVGGTDAAGATSAASAASGADASGAPSAAAVSQDEAATGASGDAGAAEAGASPDADAAREGVPSEAGAPGEEGAVSEATVIPVREDVAVALAVPAPVPGSVPGSLPASPDADDGDTILRPRGERPAEADAAPSPSSDTVASVPERGDAASDELDAGQPEHEPDRLGDHDGNTVLSSDLPRRRGSSAAAEPVAEPAAVPASVPVLHLAGGGAEPLDRPILVGRAPSVSKVPGGQMPRLVTIGTADHDISRNHAQFTLEGGTVVVTDLHSRNGTLVVLPGKGPQKLRAGEPTAVIIGTVVDFGGGVTMTVRES